MLQGANRGDGRCLVITYLLDILLNGFSVTGDCSHLSRGPGGTTAVVVLIKDNLIVCVSDDKLVCLAGK